jgi:hypothetical protein
VGFDCLCLSSEHEKILKGGKNKAKFFRKSLVKKERRVSMNTKIDSTSRRGFLKGMAVGAGGYALGASLIYPQEAIGQSIDGNLDKVPIEVRWDLAANTVIFWSVNYFKEIYDARGREQYLEHWKKTSPVVAVRGQGLASSLGLTGSDAKSAAEVIPAFLTIVYGPKQKYETVETTAESARLKCINCQLWNHVQTRKITDDLCSVHSQYWWDGFVKAMNPKLTSTLVKARPRGDSVCEWAIELKA